MRCDVVVVGGGPAGLYTALHIRNLEVLVLEEHARFGLPKHCAGIVGSWTAQQISTLSKRLITASYKTIRFVTPKGTYSIHSRTPLAYHVDRPELENVLACQVESLGHKVMTRQKAKPTLGLRVRTTATDIDYGVLVIAEGALSVFRSVLIRGTEHYLYGLQFIVRTKNPVENSVLTVYYDCLNPDFFAWIIPLDATTIKVGYASRRPSHSYIERLTKRAGIELASILERFGGPIPLNKPPKIPVFAGRVVLHGDSVPLVKPYTGGGLFWIFKLTPIMAEHIERGALNEYARRYKAIFYLRSEVERTIAGVLRRTRYHIPVKFVHALSKMGLLDPRDFDNHLMIAVKSLITLPLSTLL